MTCTGPCSDHDNLQHYNSSTRTKGPYTQPLSHDNYGCIMYLVSKGSCFSLTERTDLTHSITASHGHLYSHHPIPSFDCSLSGHYHLLHLVTTLYHLLYLVTTLYHIVTTLYHLLITLYSFRFPFTTF